MKKLIYLISLTLTVLVTACSEKKEGFNVSGRISDAKGKMLYLEATSLQGTKGLDSVKLSEDGDFSFWGERPANPEFYRLRLENQLVHFCIDSTEQVTVEGKAASFASDYEIEGSEPSKVIREISLRQQEIEKKIQEIGMDEHMTLGEKQHAVSEMVARYKEEIKMNYILNNPATPSAYFALFQAIHGQLLFNPVNDPEDVRWFAAVATAWDQLYPGTERSENLKNITLQGQRNTRKPQPVVVELDDDKVRTTGIIDIALKNIRGEEKKLSDLAGKVVLLDFTLYSSGFSQERILEMRRLYQAYQAQGLEIYQVSFDGNEHYWKTVCESLPWICVYDPKGLSSNYGVLYNIQQLPCSFLIDRNNDLVCRVTGDLNLKEEIEKLLAK